MISIANNRLARLPAATTKPGRGRIGEQPLTFADVWAIWAEAGIGRRSPVPHAEFL
jgi:hypothetical protein